MVSASYPATCASNRLSLSHQFMLLNCPSQWLATPPPPPQAAGRATIVCDLSSVYDYKCSLHLIDFVPAEVSWHVSVRCVCDGLCVCEAVYEYVCVLVVCVCVRPCMSEYVCVLECVCVRPCMSLYPGVCVSLY